MIGAGPWLPDLSLRAPLRPTGCLDAGPQMQGKLEGSQAPAPTCLPPRLERLFDNKFPLY
ncbi:hypothetical protein PAL_GLEAN10012509 [Pteropus alecto]|uniref:Uncharacterized protein n=1 Tax=Pteropus alecto TaxID=9402 RepID=L5K920_PTEAL|nr:hypothetical protein PAL_GLEAN10012509 [Pteropus alecto]